MEAIFSIVVRSELGQKIAAQIIIGFLMLMGFVWDGWWLWAALVFLFGRSYAEPMDQITELDGKRKALGILALIVFILCFTPVPLQLFS
jgi:hypothetical protein